MRGVLRTAVLTTTAALALSGCGSGDEPIDILSEGAWPGRYSDARNSSTAVADGLSDVSVAWTRSVGGAVGSPPSIAANGQIFVSASTDAGCNLFAFQIDTGRKRWCTRLAPGVGVVTPVADTVANRPHARVAEFRRFVQTGDLAIPRACGATWLVVDRQRFPQLSPRLPLVHRDGRWALYRLGA